jgi:hypothetical protein
MRFVRVYTLAGALVNVSEQEVPFEPSFGIAVDDDGSAFVMHEIGLVEDFVPEDLDGNPCSPARHLFARMEREPGVDPARSFRAKPGHVLPAVSDCPTTLEGIKQRLRERGPEGIPAKARAWLTLMLPPAEVDALGIGRGIPLSALKALDDMRTRRDPSVGSRAVVLERRAQEQSDERTEANLKAKGQA